MAFKRAALGWHEILFLLPASEVFRKQKSVKRALKCHAHCLPLPQEPSWSWKDKEPRSFPALQACVNKGLVAEPQEELLIAQRATEPGGAGELAS